jgi:hypothetical protein
LPGAFGSGGAGVGGSMNIVIQRDENGEQRIIRVKDTEIITVDHITKIQEMSPSQAKT